MMGVSQLADVFYSAKPSIPVPTGFIIAFFALVIIVGIFLFMLRRNK